MKKNNVRRYYKFADTIIEINIPEDIDIPTNMSKFRVYDEAAEYKYDINVTGNLKSIVDDFTEHNRIDQEIRRKNMIILISGEIELRIIWIIGTNIPYAVTIEKNRFESTVWVDEWIKDQLTSDTIFGSLFSLEKKVIDHNGLILHSAYILKDGEAVLFTAPSGTGKSTQADLWEKYRGTKTINGDRTLLSFDEKGWHAYGWPICGSSEICNNETYPLNAIVIISQSDNNYVEQVKGIHAFKVLTSEITINMWNKEFQNKAFDLIQKLIYEVPIYHLKCDISEDAVKCLEKALK